MDTVRDLGRIVAERLIIARTYESGTTYLRVDKEIKYNVVTSIAYG